MRALSRMDVRCQGSFVEMLSCVTHEPGQDSAARGRSLWQDPPWWWPVLCPSIMCNFSEFGGDMGKFQTLKDSAVSSQTWLHIRHISGFQGNKTTRDALVCKCLLLQMICQGWFCFCFLENKLAACWNDCFMPHSYSWVSGKNLAGINLIPLTSCWQTHQKGWKRCHNLWLCKYLNQDCSEANCRADDNVALLYHISNRFDRWIWMLIFHK